MPDNHNEFFRRSGFEEYYADQMAEQPSTEIKVRFRLNQSKVPSQLGTELWKLWSMELTRSNSDGNIFIVSGIPPNYDFGEHEVMEVVKKHAKNAELV